MVARFAKVKPLPYSEHEPFVRTMGDEPSDLVTPAVYADWLEERGRPVLADHFRKLASQQDESRHGPTTNERIAWPHSEPVNLRAAGHMVPHVVVYHDSGWRSIRSPTVSIVYPDHADKRPWDGPQPVGKINWAMHFPLVFPNYQDMESHIEGLRKEGFPVINLRG
jgi:uncharacterized protein (TIGR02996 family)